MIALGCRGGQEPPTPAAPIEAPAAEDGVPTEAAPEPTEPAPAFAEPGAGEAEAEEPAAADPVAAPSYAPPRDLSAELRAAMGSPADCLRDYRPSYATTIRIDIRAVVRPSGMIIEPTATGRGLSRNDTRCVEQRAGAVVLEPLSGDTSEPVSTYVEIPYQPPTVEEYDVAPPPPPAKGVVQPLPKKTPIAPSGKPIEGPAADPIEGPSGKPIDGPAAVPISGPKAIPIGSK
jgi:hypothetical protein